MGNHYGVVECYDNEAVDALLNTLGYGLSRPSFSHLTDLRLAVPTTRDVGLLGTALAPATKASLRHLLLIITDRTGASGAFSLSGHQNEEGNDDGDGRFEQYTTNMPSNRQYIYPNRAPCHEAAFWRFIAECGNLESLGIQATHYLDLDQLADFRPGRGLKAVSLSRLWTSTHSLLQLLSAGATEEGEGRSRSPIRRINLDDVKIKAPPPRCRADPLATETWARVFVHLAEACTELQFCRAAHLSYFKAHPAFCPRKSSCAARRKPWSRHAADGLAMEALLQILVRRAGGPMAYPDDATECLGLEEISLDDASARELEERAAFPDSSCSPS